MPTANGTLHKHADGRSTIRFERPLKHSIDKVWRAITDPAELKHWFPMSVELELKRGGKMRFEDANLPEPFDGEITELDPPKVLAYRWGTDMLRFELTPEPDGCLLVMTQTFADDDVKPARDSAGWHVCLEVLEATLDGKPVTWSTEERWSAVYPSYVKAMGGRMMSHDEAIQTAVTEFEGSTKSKG